jgi:hypothetical protein
MDSKQQSTTVHISDDSRDQNGDGDSESMME